MSEAPLQSEPCSQCGARKALHRLRLSSLGKQFPPRGWRRFHDALWCDACWKRAYRITAHEFALLWPNGKDERDELGAALRQTFGDMSALANVAMSMLWSSDTRRIPGMSKLGPMPRPDLYGGARAWFPRLPTKTLGAVIDRAAKVYGRKRFAVNWIASESVPTAKYGTAPIPVVGAGWTLERDKDGWAVGVRIGDARRHLRLRTHGREHGVRMLEQIDSGAALQVELQILRRRDGRRETPESSERLPAGGQRVAYKIMIKVVAWIPRTEQLSRHAVGTMQVRTGVSALLTAAMAGDEQPWTYHANHAVRFLLEQHRRKLDALSDDRKCEIRMTRAKRRRMNHYSAITCEKHARRMKAILGEAASLLVNYARRRRAAALSYDDSDKQYDVLSFPWHQLKAEVKQRCERIGMAFMDGAPLDEEKESEA